mgnify:CR=1 FL=1
MVSAGFGWDLGGLAGGAATFTDDLDSLEGGAVTFTDDLVVDLVVGFCGDTGLTGADLGVAGLTFLEAVAFVEGCCRLTDLFPLS